MINKKWESNEYDSTKEEEFLPSYTKPNFEEGILISWTENLTPNKEYIGATSEYPALLTTIVFFYR